MVLHCHKTLAIKVDQMVVAHLNRKGVVDMFNGWMLGRRLFTREDPSIVLPRYIKQFMCSLLFDDDTEKNRIRESLEIEGNRMTQDRAVKLAQK